MSKIQAIHMDKFESLTDFQKAVQELTDQGFWPLVMWQAKLLYTAVPPEAMKAVIGRQVLDRWAENPQILSDLQSRIEKEEAEDWK